MATSRPGEMSPTAPTYSSPLNPHASTSSSPTRTSLERPAALAAPASSLLGQIAANVEPIDVTPPSGAKPDALVGSSGTGRLQPSLRETLGRVRAGLGDSGPGSGASGLTSPSSALGAGTGALSPLSGGGAGAAGVGGGGSGGRVGQQQQQAQAAWERQRHQSAIDRTDAVWAEMQQTLRDVELSAGVGTHFFGRGHPAALEELRTAQIALAQAWARGAAAQGGGVGASNTNETAEEPKEKDTTKNVDASSQKSPGASMSEADADETEADMAAARRRREASDRYFERVSRHVGDVTKKLEDVAVAMGKVEEESREGWSESDLNLDSASQTS